MLTEKFLLSLSWFAALTGGILISRFLAQRLPDLLRRLRRRKNKAEEGGDIYTQTREFCSGPYTIGGNVTVGRVDTKTLVVGQKVHMITCECYEGKDGTVVKVTPSGVELRATDGGLYRFDNKGYELDADRRDRLGFGPSPGDTFHTVLWSSAPEFMPWRLLMERTPPSAEATAWEKVHALEPGQHGRITYVTNESVRCICGWTAESQDQNLFDRRAKLERKIMEHAEEIVKRHEIQPSPSRPKVEAKFLPEK